LRNTLRQKVIYKKET